MNSTKHQILSHCAGFVAALSLMQTAATAADGGSWYTSFSGDYFNFESNYELDGGTGLSLAKGKKSGSLYGGTLGLGLPAWFDEEGKPKMLVEGSFRTGRLTGSVVYNAGPAVSSVATEWDEAALLARFYPKSLPFTFDGRAFWTWTVGAKYSQWRTAERLLTPPFVFVSTASPNRSYKTQAYLLDSSLEYGYYLARKQMGNDKFLNWGVRGQGNAAAGYGVISGNITGSSFAYNLGAKATMFLDYAVVKPTSAFTIFAEGGWLYTFWGSSREVESESDSIKGPYARAGMRFKF